MDDHLQNDPERAGGLIADAQGEFVEQESGGAFDPRAFRSPGRSSGSSSGGDLGSGAASSADTGAASSADAAPSADTDANAASSDHAGSSADAEAPMDNAHMVAPGEEIDKAR